MKQIYLDNAATTKVDEKVLRAMLPYFSEKFGNASSQHTLGQEAKRALEESRNIIARAIGCKRDEIIFTGSGTEANNFALKGLFFSLGKEKNHIITTKIEHDCILNTCKWLEKQGCKITYLDVDEKGFVNLEQLKNSITKKTLLVSVIHGNNEIGTIQDIVKIAEICKKNNVYFHTDACQSFTKVPINVKKQEIDLMTLNAHKIHGPKGVGALFIKKEIQNKIDILMHGGGHEFGLRSSTENISGIVGFAKAVSISKNSNIRYMKKLRNLMIERLLKIKGVEINGPLGEKRLCNNINIRFNNIEGEAVGGYLDAYGIYSSTGSACSSHKLESSHVLKAIGIDKGKANTSVRLSLSKNNTKKEIDYALDIIEKIVEKLRKMSPIKL